MNRTHVIAVCNQKGGTAKTTTAVNLGVGLALGGRHVLLLDADPQSDLSASLGWKNTDDLETTLATIMGKIIRDEPLSPHEGILQHPEGVDVLPANLSLSQMELGLVNAMSRENVMKNYLREVKNDYDYVIIDCMPSLGMLTLNALTAADEVIIPVQAQYLPAKGMTQLLQTVAKVKRQLNPNLRIGGIVMTLVDSRTNLAKDTIDTIRESYGSGIRIFQAEIPLSVRAAEASGKGESIYAYDPKGKAAAAYAELTKEVMHDAERQKDRLRSAGAR